MTSDLRADARCQACGGPLPANAFGAICAQCALRGALEAAAEDWVTEQLLAPRTAGLGLLAEMRATAVEGSPEFATLAETTGAMIGRYELVEKIGEGGFGAVYVAQQSEPVKRQVALKIIKLGMDTRQVVARFEAERQALALMDHPHIAKVLDAGATSTGRPYFVMELVRGLAVTRFCSEQKLSTPARLSLFIKICQAIQHAHQKGVIHRDIKPSNILVTLQDGIPVPKVIDFGIARATQQELTERTAYTGFHQFVGTPAYMSPEQAELSGYDIDTRSDIYSLGVLLYELLTGRTPFDTRELLGSGLEGMRRIIREREPVRPSTRVRQTASCTLPGFGPQPLPAPFSTDLDWIVMKCLEKDRGRRYETASGLAQDIERYLTHEPVWARPVSGLYRVRKFVRRNRVAVTAVTGIVAALVLGLGLSTWLFFGEQAARSRAVKAEQEQRRLREEAEANHYAADMNLAQHALNANDVGRAWNLLNRHRPAADGQAASPTPDLRHWEWRYLWQCCQSDELFTLFHEPTWVETIQFLPDGRGLAVRKGDGQVALWDWRARRCLLEVPSTPFARDNPFLQTLSMVRDFAFLPLGNLLAVASTSPDRQTEVVLWDPNTGIVQDRFPHPRQILSLTASPDGTFLAIRDDQPFVTILDVQSRQARTRLPVSPLIRSVPTAFQFSPDGERLAIGDYDGHIRVAQWRTGVELHFPPDPMTKGFTCVTWSPVQPLIAASGGMESGVEDKIVRLWNPLTGKSSGELRGHADWISALAFTPDGKFLASASADRTVRLWRVADASEVRRFKGHMDEVWAVAFTPDGKTLASGDKAGTVRLWDPFTTNSNPGHVLLPDLVDALAFTPDGQALLTAGRDGRLRLRDAPAGRAVEELLGFGTNSYGLALSTDGAWLAVGDRTGAVQIWDWPSRIALTNLPTPPVLTGELFFSARRRFLLGQLELPNSAAAQRIWDTVTWRELRPPQPTGPNLVVSLAVSPREDAFAAGFLDGTIKLWSLPSTELLASFKEHRLTIRGLAFDPGGKLLASAGGDGYVNVWDVPSQRRVANFRGHPNTVSGPSFSSDGRRLAMAILGVRVWDVTTFRELITLQPDGPSSKHALFSPDGNTLATLSAAGLVEIWSAPAFSEIEVRERNQGNAAEESPY